MIQKPSDRTPSTPKYRRKRRQHSRDTAFVELDGKRVPLGFFGTPESRQEYHTVVAEWEANGRRLPSKPSPDIRVCEIMAGYVAHCERRFACRRSGYKNMSRIKAALRPVRELYGHTPAVDFGPRALLAVRERYIKLAWARKTVNERVQVVKAMFRWSVREEMIPPTVHHALSTVEGLRCGESTAAEPKRIAPVPDEDVEAVLGHVLRPVAAMIRLQRVTGMRPGEAIQMRGCDLDTTGSLWAYRPPHHKSEHRGIEREIVIGPRGQSVLKPFLRTALKEHLFRPDEAEAARDAERRTNRRTPLWPSHAARYERNRKATPKRAPRDHYDVTTYAEAVRRACEKAKVPVWTPHRLRHSYATAVRKQYGLEAARVMLGHQHVGVSEIYAERDHGVALTIAAAVG